MKVLASVLSALTLAFAISNAVKRNAKNETVLEENKIVGGVEIDISYVPSQVAILIEAEMICTGTLIKKKIVLSAAHCLDEVTPDEIKDHKLEIRSGSNHHDKEGRLVVVIRVTKHPDYAKAENYVNCDIALFFLAESAIVDGISAAIIVLYDTGASFPPGTYGTLAAWGPTEEGSDELSPVLRRVALPIVSHAVCAASIGQVNANHFICAGFSTGMKYGCEGDSGAGLVIGTKLAGVFSFRFHPLLRKPSAFTSVPAFRHWIRQESGV